MYFMWYVHKQLFYFIVRSSLVRVNDAGTFGSISRSRQTYKRWCRGLCSALPGTGWREACRCPSALSPWDFAGGLRGSTARRSTRSPRGRSQRRLTSSFRHLHLHWVSAALERSVAAETREIRQRQSCSSLWVVWESCILVTATPCPLRHNTTIAPDLTIHLFKIVECWMIKQQLKRADITRFNNWRSWKFFQRGKGR